MIGDVVPIEVLMNSPNIHRVQGGVLRADLPGHIPTLVELLEHCGTDYELSLDVKDPEAAPVIVADVRSVEATMLPRTWLCDPDLERCITHRSEFPEVKILNSTRLGRLKEGPERRAASLAHHGIDGVNMHRTDWNGGLVALFHRFNLYAFGWDLQFDDQLETAFRMGLDGVFSDHVDIMMDAFYKQIGGPIPE